MHVRSRMGQRLHIAAPARRARGLRHSLEPTSARVMSSLNRLSIVCQPHRHPLSLDYILVYTGYSLALPTLVPCSTMHNKK